MSEQNQEPVITKIEFDEKTAIPEIIEVSEKDLAKQEKKEAKLSHAHQKAIDHATRRAERQCL